MRDIDVSRRRLVDAAARALARRPRSTLAEIARAAGISRATLHRVFPGREDLLRAIAADALSAVEREVDRLPLRRGPPLDVLGQVTAALIPLGARFHFLVSQTWLDDEPEVATRLGRVRARLAAVVERAREAGNLRTDVPTEFQERLLFELVYLGWGCIADEILVPRDAARAVTDSFLAGQRAPPALAATRRTR